MARQTQYGLTALDIEEFGGLNSLLQASNLPPFMSPDCADVEFFPRLVKTRPGLTDQYPDQVIVGTFTGTVTYTLPDEITKRFLAFAGTTLYKDVSGTLTSISDAMKSGDLCNFSPAFGREYMAFGDSRHGVDIPRQYDDTNFDRVSQVGPGAAPTPTVAPFLVIDTMARTENVTAVVLTDPFLFAVGDLITISANTDPSFNGTYPVCSVIDSTHFSFFNVAIEYSITTMSRVSNVVTATIVGGNGAAYVGAGADIVVTSSADPTFNGRYVVVSIDSTGTVATWAQTGLDSVANGGTLYAKYWNGTYYGLLYEVTAVSVVSGQVTATVDFSVNGFSLPAGYGVRPAFQPPYQPGLTAFMDWSAPIFVAGFKTITSADIQSENVSVVQLTDSSPDGNFSGYSIISTPDASTTGGTLGATGNITAGIHQVAVSFITRNGYITKPSPPALFVAPGNTALDLTNIPIGPANVIGRLLMFTAVIVRPALTGPFFSIESTMQINDNTTTSLAFDFADAELVAGTPTDDLFNLVELGECSGVLNYASCMLWWGERAKLNNMPNLTFDGGWSIGGGTGGGDAPLGWTSDPTPADGAGGSKRTSLIFGDAYGMTGDGVSFSRGGLYQAAFQDYLGNPIFRVGVSYSLRVKHYAAATVAETYTLYFDLYSPSMGMSITSLYITVPASTTPSETIDILMTPQTSLPTDLRFRMAAVNTLPNGRVLIVDNIEVFETPTPYNGSIIRASGVEDPDSYNGVTGFLQPDPNNGQEIRACFTLRNFLYIVKQRSLYVTEASDTEPSTWNIQEVSNKVGTLSSRGVGVGEEWALIAGRDGLYLFGGGVPEKVSEEIQPTWDAINWNYGHLIEVTVDTRRKRAYIAVPYGASTTNNRILTLDFVEGFSDPIGHKGMGRKWCPWMIDSGCVDLIEVTDGTLQVFIGQDGLVSMLDSAALTDNGDKINDYWQTGFFQNNSRLLFGYLSANVVGSGLVNLTIRRGDQNDLKYVRGWNLTTNGFSNMERQIQYTGQRMALKFASNGTGDYFSLQGMKLYVEPSIWTPIRGVNFNG